MASDINGILMRYEIDTFEILQSKRKGNLLVTDPIATTDGGFSASMMDVPWGSIQHLGHHNWEQEQLNGVTVFFDCDTYVGRQVQQSSRILLYDYEIYEFDVSRKIYQLKPTSNSFIATWYNGTTAAHWTLNLCCGGYGGWEYAFKIAHDYGWPFHFHIGIDHSLPAAAQHSINHQTQLLPNVKIEASFLADRHKSTTICAPIQAQGWRQAVSMINPQIWTFSFPCQSWTGAAWSKGFLDENGKVLLEGLGMARIMRPTLIMLENVKNFSLHSQFADFCRIVHWCGYRFLQQATIDAQERIPCVRPRWLAILERIEESPQPFQWPKWEVKNQNLMTWGCHMKSTTEEMMEFLISPEVVQKYMDVSYLPLHAPYWAKNNLLNYRAVPLQNKMPVVMAAYGRQHELRDDLLQSRGLFGHFTAEHCKFRWWKPSELILAHMQNESLALLKPKENAWQIIGNSITQHHALITVYAAFDHRYGSNRFSFTDILEQTENKRMTPETVQLQADEFAWYLGSDEKIDGIKKHVQLLAKELGWATSKQIQWPSNCYFDIEQGFVSFDSLQHIDPYIQVSPTIPFSMEPCEDTEELPQQANSPIHSPADLIPDTLDCDIQMKFHLDQFANNKHEADEEQIESEQMHSPVCQDDYQIASDASMTSEVEQEFTDEMLQVNLQNSMIVDDHPKNETINMIALLMEPGNYASLCILSDIPTITLTQLWDHRVGMIQAEVYCEIGLKDDALRSPHEPVITGCLMSINPQSRYVHQAALCDQHEKLLLFDIAGQTFAQKFHESMIPDLAKFPAHEQHEWYDELGLLQKTPSTSNMRVFSEPPEYGICHDIYDYIEAMSRVHYEARIPSNSDLLVLQFRGQETDLAKVLTFWQIAIDTKWIVKHSRALIRQIVDSKCAQLIFQPRGVTFATPVSIFRYALENHLLMTLLNSLNTSDVNRSVNFKVGARNLPTCTLDADLKWETLLVALKHIYTINEFGQQPCVIHAGKRICNGIIRDDIYEQDSPKKVHIMRPLMGGTGSKVEHKQAVHAGLSSLLLEHGVNFKQVPEHITSMIQQFGIPRLTALLFSEDPDKKESTFRDLCQQAGIHLPNKAGHSSKAKAKFQKLGSEKTNQEMRHLDVTKYKLKEGYFLTSQGKSLPITSEFSPCIPSVTMMTAEDAKQWTSQASKLLPDELAIFIVGELDIPNLPIKQLIAPAINTEGQQCLIAGYLLQLGDKQVTTATDEGALVQTHDVQICSFTMWKQDFTDEEWQEATKSPVRFSKKLLAKDGLEEVLRNPFGRAFRQNSKPCGPQEATSIQYHSEVKLVDLRKLLRRSGFNRLFITPKTVHGKPSDQWRVIWLPQSIQQLEAICLGQACTAGLIRGRKSQGIRVESSHFHEMWEKFHPGTEPPKKTPQGDIYKIQPLPFGVDREVLQEWADTNSWEMHPIRPLGAKTWLVNAVNPPPREVMFFNSNPLLINKMQPKTNDTPIGLVAGPKSANSVLAIPQVRQPTVYRTGDPFLDPWQSSATSSTIKPESGPTEKYLQQHDQQIKKLEHAVQELQTMAKDNVKQQDEKFHKIETQMQAQANHTQAVLQSFESSLAQAMAQQENRISSSMDELKQLLLRKDKRARKPSDDISED